MPLEETITIARSKFLGEKPQEVPIPRSLGSVRLLDEIGRGGSGTVYRGRDELLSRTVAVKFVSGAIPGASDPGFTEFLEGARSAAGIHHTGLTTIYQAGVVEEVPYVIMQFVDGPTVSQLLRHDPLSVDESLTILLQAVDLAAVLHERGTVHRDIKPSNLMVDVDGHLYLTDFGLAYRRGAGESATVAWAGTPAYMAPEMFDGQVSPRSDVYALGITACELLIGRIPFSGTIDEVREQHRSADLPLDALKKRGLKANLLDVLDRAAHKRSMYRYKTAAQFADALKLACPKLKTAAQIEVSLAQRVTAYRNSAAAVNRKSDTDTPRSAGSLHEHLNELISQKQNRRKKEWNET
jgi:serine/threonine-protein kinase